MPTTAWARGSLQSWARAVAGLNPVTRPVCAQRNAMHGLTGDPDQNQIQELPRPCSQVSVILSQGRDSRREKSFLEFSFSRFAFQPHFDCDYEQVAFLLVFSLEPAADRSGALVTWFVGFGMEWGLSPPYLSRRALWL